MQRVILIQMVPASVLLCLNSAAIWIKILELLLELFVSKVQTICILVCASLVLGNCGSLR